MEASIVDLRYRMKDVLRALRRRERVHILYRGRRRGILLPTEPRRPRKVAEHPFFGMARGSKRSVQRQMRNLRAGRYHAL